MIFILNYLIKFIVKIIKFLNKGNGYTFPGYLTLKFFPDILRSKTFRYKKGIVLISGTNGKTTTSKLIADIFKSRGMHVVTNSTGSNLLRGIVTTLFLDLDFFGKPRADIAILEVDELVLPLVLEYLKPKVLVLLNLSRDQLDRYGETDTVLSKWVAALERLPKKSTLVTDSTQQVLNVLKGVFEGDTESFNAFAARGVHAKESFNVKNINAALKVASIYGLGLDKCLDVVNNFEYAYGRGETIGYEGNNFKVYLAKNPASFNSNLEMLSDLKPGAFTHLLFVLNDGVPDGRDVSWIYDIDPVLLRATIKNIGIATDNVFVSGTRCFDMAARLGYAGISVPKTNVRPGVGETLSLLKNGGSGSEDSFAVLPNYSAMLEFRKLTLGRNIL